ncbi:MAG TPA: hypothetical protein VMZ32_03310 [Gammaproteobacteria bacterium]|nr:hypothetical protein [Gammaproteobacteria bacterium]
MKMLFPVLLTLLNLNAAVAASGANSVATDSARSAEYLSVSVDRVVVDTAGLAAASATLAGAVDRLALAIAQLSADSAGFDEEQKRILLDAVISARQSSIALTELARQLPQSAQALSERLPQIISEVSVPLAALSSSLQVARDSIAMITESLPQATENANRLVDSALDSALQKLIVYSIVLIVIVALALIAIMWFIYSQYLRPLVRKLDELVGAPEHFENMARHMQETSNNLLALQDGKAPLRPGGASRYQRR